MHASALPASALASRFAQYVDSLAALALEALTWLFVPALCAITEIAHDAPKRFVVEPFQPIPAHRDHLYLRTAHIRSTLRRAFFIFARSTPQSEIFAGQQAKFSAESTIC